MYEKYEITTQDGTVEVEVTSVEVSTSGALIVKFGAYPPAIYAPGTWIKALPARMKMTPVT